jgi:hypothetical protein
LAPESQLSPLKLSDFKEFQIRHLKLIPGQEAKAKDLYNCVLLQGKQILTELIL